MLFGPRAGYAHATAARLYRANLLGLLHPEGRPITQGEAHAMLLDYYYLPESEGGGLRNPDA